MEVSTAMEAAVDEAAEDPEVSETETGFCLFVRWTYISTEKYVFNCPDHAVVSADWVVCLIVYVHLTNKILHDGGLTLSPGVAPLFFFRQKNKPEYGLCSNEHVVESNDR